MSAFVLTWPVTWPDTWIGETLIASALLIVAVLILRRPAARLVGPRAAYLLWAVPALRLLLPPLPRPGLGPVSLVEASAFAPQAAGGLTFPGAAAVEIVPTLQQAVAFAPAFDWGLALAVLWLAGAAIHMAWHVISYRRFISGAVGARAPEHVVDGIGVHSADIAGPAAAGIVRRLILLPYDFADRFDPRERRLALAHEVAHHRRGDLVANWIALVVLSLHWFNPLAHIAYRAFRADQELACDATVLGAASERERHAYASAVVKAAWVKSPVAACPMNSAGQLKARLAMMKAGAIRRPLVGLVAVAVIAATALGATASRTAAALPARQAAPAALAALERPVDMAANPFDDARPAVIDAPAAPADRAAERDEAGPDASAPPAGASEGGSVLAAPVLQLAAAEDRPEPLVADPALLVVSQVQPVTLSSGDDHRSDPQPLAVTPAAALAALPSPDDLKANAIAARKELMTLSRRVVGVSDVRAVMVDGRFNAAEPGVPFAGFCGQVRLNGESTSHPFFVSTTPSKPGRSAKCSGAQSAEDYSRYLQPTPVQRAALRAARDACTADRSSCTVPFSRLAPAYPTVNEFLNGTS